MRRLQHALCAGGKFGFGTLPFGHKLGLNVRQHPLRLRGLPRLQRLLYVAVPLQEPFRVLRALLQVLATPCLDALQQRRQLLLLLAAELGLRERRG